MSNDNCVRSGSVLAIAVVGAGISKANGIYVENPTTVDIDGGFTKVWTKNGIDNTLPRIWYSYLDSMWVIDVDEERTYDYTSPGDYNNGAPPNVSFEVNTAGAGPGPSTNLTTTTRSYVRRSGNTSYILNKSRINTTP